MQILQKSMGAEFPFRLFILFSGIFTILFWNINNAKSTKKIKKKSLYYRNRIGQTIFLDVSLIFE